MSFIVPEGCTESGPISITTKYGTTESTKFEFNDRRGLMADFDGDGDLGSSNGIVPQGWNIAAKAYDENGLAGCGRYVQLGDGSTTTDGGWIESFKLPFWAGNWGGDPMSIEPGNAGCPFCNFIDFTDFQNMAVKFELYIPKSNPWSAGAMQLVFTNAKTAASEEWQNNTYINTKDDEKPGPGLCRGLYRPWEQTGSFDTGDKWITVTVPISEFVYNADGTKGIVPLSSADDFATFVLWPWRGGVKGTECTPIFRIDNIRAVPSK